VAVHGQNLAIRLTAQPREVPYQITAPDGLTATAVVYVPGLAASAIRLRAGARIALKKDGAATVPLSSVLIDTTGRPLKITTLNELTASPSGDIAVDANQSTAFQVRALGDYTGPGAVSVQVYDGSTLQDSHGYTETVTIPVQVGPDVPVLRCPQAALDVVEGGAPLSYDIAQLCHVWVDTTIAAPVSRYTLAWSKQPGGVAASVIGGTDLQLAGASDAAPGTTGTLRIIPAGATTGGTVNVAVIKAPLPSGRPASVSVKAGQSVTVDLSQYVTSPLAQPDIQVLNATRPVGATVASSGSTVTIAPGASTHGTLSLVATVTDVAGRSDRAIPVAITVTVIGHPGAPGQPTATESSRTIVVSFGAAAQNGAPLEYYTVYANDVPHQCPSSPCTINGLANGTKYTVYVTATNSVREGPRSGTTTITPNAVPEEVSDLSTTAGDTKVTLTWQPTAGPGTPPTGYQIEISPAPAGGQPGPLDSTSTTIGGLVNGTKYTFTVRAGNIAGQGPWSPAVTATPYGKPLTMAAPTAVGASVADPAASRAITVSWAPAQGTADNGRPVTQYTVYEYQSTSSGGLWGTPVGQRILDGGAADSTSFTVPNDSSWYEFGVSATNQAGPSTQSPLSSPAVQAVAPPDPPANLSAAATGQDGTISVTFTPQAPNSRQISSIEYGIGAETESGTLTGTFAPGTAYSETISSAMNAGIQNGTPVTIYIGECNDASMCSWDAAPSAQVIPYGPLAGPTVGATANGTAINYTWGATSDGLTETLNVCIAGGCTAYTVPPTGNYSGSATDTYGYSDTETITAYVTDTAGQRAPATGTVNASAETEAPPAPPTVTVSKGSEQYVDGCADANCYTVYISVSNFPAGTPLQYECSDDGAQFWPKSGTTDENWNGAPQYASGSGSAAFNAQCVWGYWKQNETISVTIDGHTGSYTG
jgi:hypothetical protein